MACRGLRHHRQETHRHARTIVVLLSHRRMPLRCTKDGRDLLAFDITSAQAWEELRAQNARSKSLRLPCCQSEVVLRTSKLGTRHFAHASRGDCAWASETAQHSFPAARDPSTAIENPRQVGAYNYPSQYGPKSPSFSRASLLTRQDLSALFISGTSSIVGHASVHPGDVRAQTRESLQNVEAVLDRASALARGAAFHPDDLKRNANIRDPADLDAVRGTLASRYGTAIDIRWHRADICRAELLVEFEAYGICAR